MCPESVPKRCILPYLASEIVLPHLAQPAEEQLIGPAEAVGLGHPVPVPPDLHAMLAVMLGERAVVVPGPRGPFFAAEEAHGPREHRVHILDRVLAFAATVAQTVFCYHTCGIPPGAPLHLTTQEVDGLADNALCAPCAHG